MQPSTAPPEEYRIREWTWQTVKKTSRWSKTFRRAHVVCFISFLLNTSSGGNCPADRRDFLPSVYQCGTSENCLEKHQWRQIRASGIAFVIHTERSRQRSKIYNVSSELCEIVPRDRQTVSRVMKFNGSWIQYSKESCNLC